MEKETQEEFVKVRSEFLDYQKAFDKRLDELFDEIRKPLFTYPQIIGAILSIIIYTFYITSDFSGVKYKLDTTLEKVERHDVLINNISKENKETNKENNVKTDKILETVLDIKIDVAVLKENNKEKKRPTNAQKQQMILDWANGKN